ncbi:hypothetical protein GOV12_00075 [Candidatus Pacearchaeota archaeon]|nr:hypothetical protein [Candidatus Pacearchaeota archaeon]
MKIDIGKKFSRIYVKFKFSIFKSIEGVTDNDKDINFNIPIYFNIL